MKRFMNIVFCFILTFLWLIIAGIADKLFPSMSARTYFGLIGSILPIAYVIILSALLGYGGNVLRNSHIGIGLHERMSKKIKEGLMIAAPLILLSFFWNFFAYIKQALSCGFVNNLFATIVSTILISICASFYEEMLFRNIIFHKLLGEKRLRNKNSYVFAMIVSSIMFGMYRFGIGIWHNQNMTILFIQSVYMTFLGLFFVGIYLSTRTLIVPITVHAFINVIGGLHCIYNVVEYRLVYNYVPVLLITLVVMIFTTVSSMILCRIYGRD